MKKVLLKSAIIAITGVGLMAGNAMAFQMGMDLDWVPGTTPTDIIVDNETEDRNALPGWIASESPHKIGTWDISANGLNLQTLGLSSYEELNLTVNLTSGKAGGDVWLLLAEMNLTGKGWAGSVGGTTDGTVEFFAMITENNDYWDEGQIVASASFDGQGVDNAEFSLSGVWEAIGDGSEYSMLLGAHIHHDAGGNTSFAMTASQSPELAHCGDGEINQPFEECDDGNNEDGDGCSSDCLIEPYEPYCGNGKLDPGEQCDDGNNVNGDGCSSECLIEPDEPYCGDGKLDPGEQCDDGNNINGDGCSSDCALEEVLGDEGCSPGYWKNHQRSWMGYTPDTMFSDVFEDAFPGMTLLQVLKQGGGGIKALGRHAVGALLNAASVNYLYTTQEVIDMFNDVYPDGSEDDIEGTKETLESLTHACPLN